MGRVLDVTTSLAATVARLGFAERIGTLGPRPAQPLELYEFEACPYCRKVREALTVLDLDAVIRPCPKGGSRFRPEVKRRGGKEQFPYLVDPNTGEETYESDDIVRHLFARYGTGPAPLLLTMPVVTDLTSVLASAARLGRGTRARRSKAPARPLELWSYEGSPFCRLVRETLSELELPYLLHNVAQRSPRREAFVARSGKMMVPYLADPNTGTETFESADIVAYLERTYALAPAAERPAG
jgi:glutathione S-transferase